VLLAMIVPALVLGWYGWEIISAIDDAQDRSVVELPTRSESDSPAGAIHNDNDPSRLDVAKGVFAGGTGVGASDPADVWTNQDTVTFLVVGIDERPSEPDRNADVIILARLNFTTNTMHSVSIPRDLQVNIPGHGLGKINGAYNLGIDGDPANRAGGVALVRDTIELNFDVRIDEYMLVNFNGFTDVVDALGGIQIDVPEAIVDPNYPTVDSGTTTVAFEAGPQLMDGEQALAYARTRHQDSDDARRERQMLVLLAMFESGKDIGSLTQLSEIIIATADSVQTSVDFEGQLALARLALGMDREDIHMTTISPPLVQPGTADNGAWIYVADPAEITAFIHNALDGTLDTAP